MLVPAHSLSKQPLDAGNKNMDHSQHLENQKEIRLLTREYETRVIIMLRETFFEEQKQN